MKVYCLYEPKYDVFIKEVVNIILDKYGNDLHLSSLEEIELISKEDISYETDGKVLSSRKIIVTSRLYELLPTLNINDLLENNNFKLLKKTLYHEMGHITDMTFMPKLYKCVLDNDEIDKNYIASLFWLEYIAERRTSGFENVNDLEICDDIAKRKWNCSMADPYGHYNEKNFFYLTKILPYFMARTKEPALRNFYLSNIQNKLLREYIKEIDGELKSLELMQIFDEPSVLIGLYKIIDKYYKKLV